MSVSLSAVLECIELGGLVLFLVAIVRKTPEQRNKPTLLQVAATVTFVIALLLKYGLKFHFIIPSE